MADETQTSDAPEGEAPPAPGADAAAGTDAGEALRSADFSAPEDAEAPDHADPWSPPATDERGIARDADGIPINLRLRALHLADAGKEEDPAGSVTPEAIASAGEALADYDKRYPAITGSTAKAELEKMAKAERVDISAASTNEERASAILRARPPRIL